MFHKYEKVNEECFDNFWIWFETEYSKLSNQSEVTRKIFNQIEERFIELYHKHRSDTFDIEGIAKEFWTLVISGRKFIRALTH